MAEYRDCEEAIMAEMGNVRTALDVALSSFWRHIREREIGLSAADLTECGKLAEAYLHLENVAFKLGMDYEPIELMIPDEALWEGE